MKTTTCRIAAALLAGTLALGLAGCAGQGSTQPAAAQPAAVGMGRWVQQEIDLQGRELVAGPQLLADGSLCMAALQWETAAPGGWALQRLVSRDDGATWEQAGTALEGSEDTEVRRAWIGPDGALLVAQQQAGAEADAAVSTVISTDGEGVSATDAQPEGTDAAPVFWLSRPGQEAQQLDLGALGLAEADIEGGLFWDAGTLLLGTGLPDGSCQLYLAGLDTGTATAINAAAGPDAWDLATGCVWQQSLYYLHWGDDGARSLRCIGQDGALTVLLEPATGAEGGQATAMDAEGNFYYAGSGGICRVAAGGTVAEQVVAAAGTVMDVGTNYPIQLCRTAEGSFLVGFLTTGSDEEIRLYRYRWDADLPAANDTVLELWCLTDENATVRAAVNAFAQANPSVDVQLTVGIPDLGVEDYAAARRDALTALNTRLLAGEGPDVLILDGAGYESYIGKGLLADLSAVVALDELAANLVEPFRLADGTVPVLPARFSVPILIGKPGQVEQLDSLDALQQEILACAPRPDVNAEDAEYNTPLEEASRYALSFLDAEDLATFTLQASAPAILAQGQVDAGALRRAMAFVQAVAQHYGMQGYRSPAEQIYNGVMISGGDGVISLDDHTLEYSETMRAKYGWAILQTPGLTAYQAGNYVLQPGLCAGAYLPSVLVAVNANSRHPSQAAALAATLFGSEVQGTDCQDGMPVRRAELEAQLEAANAAKSFEGDLTALVAACRTPVIVAQELYDAFVAHALALASGAEDLDAAVAGVQQDLEIYLAEQQ